MQLARRVAVLTQPLGHNYGGLLQAFALQRVLASLGCAAVTIDRRAPLPGFSARLRQGLVNGLLLGLGRIRSLPSERNLALIQAQLRRFRDEQLVLSPCFRDEAALQAYFRAQCFDAVVVGSDQVWRPRYSPDLANFFLNFLDAAGSRARRVAFSASFGVDEWEFSAAQTGMARALLQRFDAVSVREASGVGLCEQYLGCSPAWTLDPTLLLEPDDYAPWLQPVAGMLPGAVVSYVLDGDAEKQALLDAVAAQTGQAVVSALPERRWLNTPRKDLAACQYRPVGEWLFLFKHAGLVVTDSFHGCVFALLFNRPFIALGNAQRGQARFASLLGRFGLLGRLVDPAVAVNGSVMNGSVMNGSEVDWSAVNALLQQERQASRLFLQEALCCPK